MGKASQHVTIADLLGDGWRLDRQGYVLFQGKSVGQLKRRGHRGSPLYSWTLFPLDGRQGDSGSGYTDRSQALKHLHRAWVHHVGGRR